MNLKSFSLIFILLFVLIIGCSEENSNREKPSVDFDSYAGQQDSRNKSNAKTNISKKELNTDAKITFIELGSVDCVPCKMMQPVMESIEKKYGDQVNVIFYDVWTQEEKKYARIYNIKGIPTQVFLNSHGEEIYRHVGFFPEEEIDKFLKSMGLEPKQ